MTTSTVDFPVWFNAGCYGGLACCMLTIAVNTLYASWRKRGTRRQLTSGVVVCAACALLLLVAVVWYTTRFNAQPGMLAPAEVELALVYVVLLGWFLPIGTSASFCLYSSMRVVTNSVEVPKHKRRTKANATSVLRPPRHQHGVLAPFVYDQDTPWCWLEYKRGRLAGQRLALKRAIITIGREEDNDIWIDDEQASRYHAELAWDKGDVYLTDSESLNGVLLNGERIRGTAMLATGAIIEVGSQQFLFTLADHAPRLTDSYDPLSNHVWHSSDEKLTGKNPGFVLPRSQQPLPPAFPHTPVQPSQFSPLSFPSSLSATPFYRTTSDDTPPASIQEMPSMQPIQDAGTPRPPGLLNIPSLPGLLSGYKDVDTPHGTYPVRIPHTTDTSHSLGISKMFSSPHPSLPKSNEAQQTQQTAPLSKVSLPTRRTESGGMLLFRSGELVNKTRMLDQPLLTIGRDENCDITVHDVSVSRQHAQFVRQMDEVYVQDLSSQNGTFVNEQLLAKPHLLQTGDNIRIGNVRFHYVSLRQERDRLDIPVQESMSQQFSLPPVNALGQLKLPGKLHP